VSRNPDNRSVVFLSASWRNQSSELAFVTRALAGAASRVGTVNVITPAPDGLVEADGAFDVLGIGTEGGHWPRPTVTRWPRSVEAQSWVVDEVDPSARALVESFAQDQFTFSVAPTGGDGDAHLRTLRLVAPDGDGLGIHVPINPLAAQHRHMGLGFTGYILVLTDRPGRSLAVEPPTAAVGWLTSRFYDQHVVVVEGGSAAVWRGRALRGVIPVDTRTDLWRLLAHAQVTVELAPGPIIARESIESLRFGTPVIVPDATVAADHAHLGGGLAFGDVREMLAGVETLLDQSARDAYSREGSRYADAVYGDPSRFVKRLLSILWSGA
jgi:hypothetical protein